MAKNRSYRRLGILAALAIPGLIVLHGSNPVDAQFPKGPPPPGGIGGPKGFGPGGPVGPGGPGGIKLQTVWDWRCTKCGYVMATTTTPNQPALGPCPRCSALFGGGPKLNGPPNMPPGQPGPGPMGPGAGGPPAGAPLPPDVGAPAAQPAPEQPAPVAANPNCRWCHGEVSPGSTWCGGCKIKLGIILTLGGLLGVALLLVPATAIVWAMSRTSGK